MPTSDDLWTSNLFYLMITIVRKKKFEFEGILIIISILFEFLIGVRSSFWRPPFCANLICGQNMWLQKGHLAHPGKDMWLQKGHLAHPGNDMLLQKGHLAHTGKALA